MFLGHIHPSLPPLIPASLSPEPPFDFVSSFYFFKVPSLICVAHIVTDVTTNWSTVYLPGPHPKRQQTIPPPAAIHCQQYSF